MMMMESVVRNVDGTSINGGMVGDGERVGDFTSDVSIHSVSVKLEVDRVITNIANLRTKYAHRRTVLGYISMATLSVEVFADWRGPIAVVAHILMSVVIYLYGRSTYNLAKMYTSQGQPKQESGHKIYELANSFPSTQLIPEPNCHCTLTVSGVDHDVNTNDVLLHRPMTIEQHSRCHVVHVSNIESDGVTFDVMLESRGIVTREHYGDELHQNMGDYLSIQGMNSHELAHLQTMLANVRTGLAYMRVSIPFVGMVGVGFSEFGYTLGNFKVVGMGASLFVMVIMLCGRWHFTRVTKDIQQIPSAHELARIRTSLANVRTLLSYIRTGLGWAMLTIGTVTIIRHPPVKWALTGIYGVVTLSCFTVGITHFCRDRVLVSRMESFHELMIKCTAMSNVCMVLANMRLVQPLAALTIHVYERVGTVVCIIIGVSSVVLLLHTIRNTRNNTVFTQVNPSTYDSVGARLNSSNTRTLLAYLRTSMAWITLSIAVHHRHLQVVYCMVSGVIGFSILCMGVLSHRRETDRIVDLGFVSV